MVALEWQNPDSLAHYILRGQEEWTPEKNCCGDEQ
jgi:hypothetical protein